MDRFEEVNLRHWEDRASVHIGRPSEFYPISDFISGATTLRHHELALAGEVSGKNLLHLMCHIGVDSISWERRGAKVTAFDFSPSAISFAEELNNVTGSNVNFLNLSIGELAGQFSHNFDIAVLTYGVIEWVPDLELLFSDISDILNPLGRVVVVDGHPFSRMFPTDHLHKAREFLPRAYLGKGPVEHKNKKSYGGKGELRHASNFRWEYSVGDILNSAALSGLRLKTFEEMPYSFYRRYRNMSKNDLGYYEFTCGEILGIPLLFAASFQKEA